MSEQKQKFQESISSKNRNSSQFNDEDEGAEIEDEDEDEEEEDEKDEYQSDKEKDCEKECNPKKILNKSKKRNVGQKLKKQSSTSSSNITVNISSTQYDVIPKVMQDIFKFQVTTD